jgi:hypothetical protein
MSFLTEADNATLDFGKPMSLNDPKRKSEAGALRVTMRLNQTARFQERPILSRVE